MRLWQFLRAAMERHAEQVAFTGGRITYRELIAFSESGGSLKDSYRLRAACAPGKQEQAMEILKILARGDAAVPISVQYGRAQTEDICRRVREDTAAYPELAFLLFTSGTTGTPKGVMLSEENIIANLTGIDSYFNVAPGSKILIARPLVHSGVLTGELLFGLYRGLEIDFYEEAFSAARLASYLKNNDIQTFCCTPTLMFHLARYGAGEGLGTVVLSGERLPAELTEMLYQKYSGTEFYNVYGLAENSPRVCALAPQDFFRKRGSVGKPLPGTELKVVDGELWVRSPSVMAGYYGDERATALKLTDGWLHTGDAAAIDGDGYCTVLGRLDDMIIRCGVNIYPGEVENEILRFPGVEGCVVYGRQDIRYGQRVCALFTGSAETVPLKRFLARVLPPHLVPSEIEKVESLPVTASGKVIRR